MCVCVAPGRPVLTAPNSVLVTARVAVVPRQSPVTGGQARFSAGSYRDRTQVA